MKFNKINSYDYYKLINYGVILVALIMIVHRLFWPNWPSMNDGDSQSYINAWEVLKTGRIDVFRTPVYPVFIGVFIDLFGRFYGTIIVGIIQWTLFYLSIQCFRHISQKFINNRVIVLVATFVYAFWFTTLDYNNVIKTEPLSNVGLVFLTYNIVRLWEKPAFTSVLYITLWLFFLIFLRPALIFLLPLTSVYWFVCLFKDKEFRKYVLCCIAGVVFCTFSLIFYVSLMYSTYGIPMVSSVTMINGFMDLADNSKTLSSEDFGNPELRELYDYYEGAHNFERISKLCVRYDDLSDLYTEYKQIIHRHRDDFINGFEDKFYDFLDCYLFDGSHSGVTVKINSILQLPLGKTIIFVLALYFLSILMPRFFNRRRFLIEEWLLPSMLVSIVIVSLLGAYTHWERLTYPMHWSLPIMLGMIAERLLSFFRKRCVKTRHIQAL